MKRLLTLILVLAFSIVVVAGCQDEQVEMEKHQVEITEKVESEEVVVE